MELNTSDPSAAKKFYGAVFDWKYQDMEMPEGTYAMVSGPGGPIGGIQKSPMPSAPSHWLGYVGVNSLDKAVAKVTKNGGTVVVPRMDVPGMGSMAIFTDPTGAACAVWEPVAKAAAPKKKSAKKAKKKAKKAEKKSAKKSAKKKAKKAEKKAKKKAAKKQSVKAKTKGGKKRARR
jgi:hypothetical protein